MALLIEQGSIAELRIPGWNLGQTYGLFDNRGEMARTAADVRGAVPSVFVTLNPIEPSLRCRVTNRLSSRNPPITDSDIHRRRWLLLDFDPIRPGKSPSTDKEHELALDTARECRGSLQGMGWPEPVFADSGNGAHLLCRIDMPNDANGDLVVRRSLAALALRFSTKMVVLDSVNGNASRLTRVYGTMNRKGDSTDERPYRRSRLIDVPDKIGTVALELLSEMAASLPFPEHTKPVLDVARWLADYGVPIAFEAPWNSGGHKWILPCPWNDAHGNNSAFIVKFSDGGIAAGCLHKSCLGNNWPTLREHFERRSGRVKQSNSVSPLGNLAGRKKSKRADLLLDLNGKIELFCTPQGDPYANVRINDHYENHLVRSRAFEWFLRHTYYSVHKTAPPPQALHEAVAHFSAVAMFDGAGKPVAIRVASAGDLNYLDLADARWRSVEFGADGWRIVETPPVKFRRSLGMLPLPTPVRGGDINELKKFLNLRTRGDWTLFISTILAGLLSRGPYPVLGLHGEAGSAKTTTSRIIRTILDPNSSPARSMPKDNHDLMITASNNWVLVFDNLSYLPVWFSDCLCRLSTGGGHATRQLYTDADEIIFEGQRPVILNGIEELASRTDLLDRSILLDLPVIENYRQEREFWLEFEAARPRLLGALLDVAVEALRRLPQVQLSQNPRLADFAVLATAAEEALGLSTGAFMRTYSLNRENANAVSLEASPIASLISKLVEKNSWEGTAEELLRKLCSLADADVQKRRSWPKNPKMLSGMLRRLATSLRRVGIDVKFWRDRSRQRARMILIERQGGRGKVASVVPNISEPRNHRRVQN